MKPVKLLVVSQLLSVVVGLTAFPVFADSPTRSPELVKAVERDWQLQEKKLGRAPGDPASIQALIQRTDKLVERLRTLNPGDATTPAVNAWQQMRSESRNLDTLSAADRANLYHQLRWASREVALENPLLQNRPMVFMKRQRFICQMLHEYLGYFYDYGNVAGGGLCVLDEPGKSFKVRDLTQSRLPKGNFATLALSHDARTLYFAFAERAPAKPNYYSADRRGFHIYRMNVDGSDLRQLTSGSEDDFDPCPLPDGTLAFMSTRRGGFARCNNPWEPIPTHTLHRMDADGSNIRLLSRHETAEWHPSVLRDGRIVYIRWDYVDRSAANFHGLWAANLDGSGAMSLFGNYTMKINACYQPKAIPGSDRIAFIAGAHHADVGGALALLDPKRATLDPQTGEDRLDSVEVLTPDICFPESDGWPKTYFHSPNPLSEDVFITAYSHDPLPGMSSGEERDTRTGLYYFDRFGNLELLYSDAQNSCMYPNLLAPRTVPSQIASQRDPSLGDQGEFVIADVAQSLQPLPAGRPVRQLRIFQLLPKTDSHIANNPRIGHANAENARMLLGTVPVESDGSAYFRVPAGKPIYFQAVDGDGRAVQTMRSLTYLQPGERRSCVGCHEPMGKAAASRPLLAMQRPPSTLQPGPDGTLPLSYPRLVQPVLDQHCVRCHDGIPGDGKSALALTGKPAKNFTQSYANLKKFIRWHEWGGESISHIATRPGHQPTDESSLVQILVDDVHRPALKLTEADRLRIYLWLDSNAPFYGTYTKDEQLAQLKGQAVPPPRIH